MTSNSTQWGHWKLSGSLMAVYSLGCVHTDVHYLTAQDIQVILLRAAIRGRKDQENLESQKLSALLWSTLQCSLTHLNLPFLGFVLVYGAMIASFMVDQHSGKGLNATAGAVLVPDSFTAFFPFLAGKRAGTEMSLWCCVLFSDSKVPNPREMFSSPELVLGHMGLAISAVWTES